MSISFWQEEVGLPTREPSPPPVGQLECELCIVGGGVIGASLAYWAAERGVGGVLLEAREPAMGASGRNAGFVLSGVTDSYLTAVERYGRERARRLWALSIENRTTMLDFAERFGVAHARGGSLVLAESQAEADRLRTAANLMTEDGFPATFEPESHVERGFFGGLRRPDDGVTQPAALSRALLAASGFAWYSGARVEGFTEHAGRVEVRAGSLVVSARQVVLATNAYSVALHPYFVGRVLPRRGQIYLTAPAPMVLEPASYSHHGFYYFRQLPEPGRPGMGRWLLGGARHLHLESENDATEEQPTASLQRSLEQWTARHFPELAGVEVTHRWAGLMGFTPDGLPLIGTLPGHERLHFCVGFNGHGMGLGTLVAKEAVAHLLGDGLYSDFDAARLAASGDAS